MAFKEKDNFIGGVTQKIGEKTSIYGRNLVASGINNGDITIYELGDDGLWVILKTIAKSPNFGSSLDLHRGILAAGDVTAEVVYIRSSSDYYSAEISLTPLASDAGFGSSVSISDSHISIGSPSRDTNKGAVYIYEKVGDSWLSDTEDYIITPNDADTSQFFGTSVSIYDDTLIVGARGDSQSRGAVYVFVKNEETGIFEQSQKIIASDGVAGDEFGGAVSISEDYFAVGASLADTSETGINTGAVYIFSYSNRWNQLRKITSVDESELLANQFGYSVDLKGDYLIVGSPYARNKGVADIFYKKRNWGHLKKITSDQDQGDLFGGSVAIDYPNLVVGSTGYEEVDTEGKIYIFNDPPVRLRLAQEFDADFQPSKASVYLKRSGNNANTSWSLQDDRATVIDATNFSSIAEDALFADEIVAFTGNGYMTNHGASSVSNYPIRNSVPNNYNVWLRCRTGSEDISSSSDFRADMLLDGIVIQEIDTVLADGEWSWVSVPLVLPDTKQHILGIRLKEKESAVDKIYIDADTNFVPEGDGPQYIDSLYVTIHMKVYESDGSIPTNPLLAYDYKTTLDEVIQDDWYNFDISFIDKIVDEYGESLFLVMSSSGDNADNFVAWEVISSDEYSSYNAGLRLTDVASTSNTVNTSLTKRLYYQAKAGDADINTDTWYLDSTQTHAFKIFSDFDPIEDV